MGIGGAATPSRLGTQSRTGANAGAGRSTAILIGIAAVPWILSMVDFSVGRETLAWSQNSWQFERCAESCDIEALSSEAAAPGPQWSLPVTVAAGRCCAGIPKA